MLKVYQVLKKFDSTKDYILDLEQDEKDRKLKRRVRELTNLVKKSKKMSLDEVKDSIKRLDESDD